MKKLCAIFLVLLAINGCKTNITPNDLAGNYIYKADKDDQIQLFANHKYEHIIYGDEKPAIAKGSWELHSSQITFHNFNFENGKVIGDLTLNIKKVKGWLYLDYTDGQTGYMKFDINVPVDKK